MCISFARLNFAGGIDYGPFPESEVELTTTLPATSTQSQFGIQIREDSVVESTESFTVELRLAPTSPSGTVLGARSRATVFIEDNDSECCTCTVLFRDYAHLNRMLRRQRRIVTVQRSLMKLGCQCT